MRISVFLKVALLALVSPSVDAFVSTFIARRALLPSACRARCHARRLSVSSSFDQGDSKSGDDLKDVFSHPSADRPHKAREVLSRDADVGADLSDMTSAIERALKHADLVLQETSHAEWMLREAEQSKQKQFFLQEKEAAMKRLQGEGSDYPSFNPYIQMMQECAASASKGLAGRVEAFQTLKDMEGLGIIPNLSTYNALMNVLAKAAARGKATVKDGQEVLKMIKTRGFTPSTITYTTFLSLMAKSASYGHTVPLEDGLNILEKMKEQELGIDAFVFAALLSLCTYAPIKEGESRIEKGKQILALMREMGVKEDIVVYNGFLAICAKCNDAKLEDGMEVLESMRENKINPDTYTFATLFDLCANIMPRRRVTMSDVQKIVQQMQSNRVPPSTTLYNSILKVYVKAARRKWISSRETEDVIKTMEKLGLKLDRITYGTWLDILRYAALNGLAKRGDAKKVIDKMRESGMAPSSEMYHLWLDVILKEATNGAATVRDGIEVVKFMQKVGQAAKNGKDRIGTTWHCPRALLTLSPQDAGLEVLELMKTEEIPLSSVSLSTFIQMAKAEGSQRAVSEAWKLFIASPPSIRNEQVYTAMMSTLVRAKQRHTASSLLDMAKKDGLKPNVYMINSAMGACTTPEDILKLWEEMQASGLEKDAVTNKYLKLASKGRAPFSQPLAGRKFGGRPKVQNQSEE
ncbi:hypothetical protein GUITHDRAFT_147424 [Guillardia theta CCMP2712]|uniref:PROP1-like PPR domain-containing protein n=1 Tax=Guillardia theta (strain CCMP2712) TaxID=905079 RepID=L1IDI1_GUITC|nr:hypothetical protein GUITHDRAFT_147424 [Guillardia theta CCMP2712]EKX34172.1 hypothetical protein GUITHDRAFT_147424 [Guillardia theta CCMP2712]|eukprot:XP_005821152.1 hypothetical protein GUITHDRAFT_147424 [Guillardia theta CCMP2712]